MKFGSTLKEDLDAANQQIAALTLQLTNANAAKSTAEQTAQTETIRAHDLTARVEDLGAKLVATAERLTSALAKTAAAESSLKTFQTDFDSKVSTEVARQIAASGHEPLALKPEETPASQPKPAAGLTGLDRVIAAFKAEPKR